MDTPNSTAAPAPPDGRSGPARSMRLTGPAVRRSGGAAVALLAVGALLAGCASANSSSYYASPASHATTSPAGATSQAGATPASGAAASATSAPTVSGGAFLPGQAACVGWPTGATSVSLPVSFTVVSVERCVTGEQAVPGNGVWTTATLQRADSGLGPLISALRAPSITRLPGTVCPELAMVPPRIMLIGTDGQKLLPRLPVSGCGLIQSRVLAALDTLRWQPVSVRLIAKVPAVTVPTVSGAAPHSIQTVGPAS